jgi:asparagine synthase (glutamine-hydrolysing)
VERQVLDFHTYLPDDILTNVDRVSMSVALEARVPLLSKKIIEFLFSLPHNVRCSSDNLKGLMNTAYLDRLPDCIINRSKKKIQYSNEHLASIRLGDCDEFPGTCATRTFS